MQQDIVFTGAIPRIDLVGIDGIVPDDKIFAVVVSIEFMLQGVIAFVWDCDWLKGEGCRCNCRVSFRFQCLYFVQFVGLFAICCHNEGALVFRH